MRNKTLHSLLAAGSLLVLGGLTGFPAQAAVKWTFGGTAHCDSEDTGDAWGNICTPSVIDPATGSPTVNAKGWSNTGGSNADAALQTLETAHLKSYSGGLGINNRDGANGTDANDVLDRAPEHAVDNEQRYDSIVLSFSEAVKLTEISIGWPKSGYDTDITLLAYTGGGTFADQAAFESAKLQGKTYAQLAAAGWTLVGHYYDVNTLLGDKVTVNTPNSIYSSYWMVGAYNNLVLDGSGKAGNSNYAGNDYFKLYTVSGDKKPPQQQVPEPGSLALLGLGTLLLVRARRRA